MTQHCCVQDCKHNKKTSSCTFKRFPTDPQKRKLWETLVRRSVGSRSGASEWKRTAWDRICECHFDDDQFERNRQDGLRKLRWDAVPRLFGSKAKFPSHRPLKVPQKPSRAEPGHSNTSEESTENLKENPSSMSSEGEVSLKDDDLLSGHDQTAASDQFSYKLESFTQDTEAESASNTADDAGADSAPVETEKTTVSEVSTVVEGILYAETEHHVSEELTTDLTEVLDSVSESDSVGALTLVSEAASGIDLCQESNLQSESGMAIIDASNLSEVAKEDSEEAETTMDNTEGLDNDQVEIREEVACENPEYVEQDPCISQNDQVDTQEEVAGANPEYVEQEPSGSQNDEVKTQEEEACTNLEYVEQDPSISQDVTIDPEHLYENNGSADGEEMEQLLESHEVSQEDANSGDASYNEMEEEVLEHEVEGEFDNEGDNVDGEVNVGEDDDNGEEEVDELDAEDNNEGEEQLVGFEGEEESEDGEDMGEEVEVEIQDCSDTEMEQDGAFTYIITEGMIVVEENESAESYQTSDAGAIVSEELGLCEEQMGSGQKTKRIVIKVPSSKSVPDVEYVSNTDLPNVQEIVGMCAEQPSQEIPVATCSTLPSVEQMETVASGETSETVSKEAGSIMEADGVLITGPEAKDDSCKETNLMGSTDLKNSDGKNDILSQNLLEEAHVKNKEETTSNDCISSPKEVSLPEESISKPEEASSSSKTTSKIESVAMPSACPPTPPSDSNNQAKDSDVLKDPKSSSYSKGCAKNAVGRLEKDHPKSLSKEPPSKSTSVKSAEKPSKELMKESYKERDRHNSKSVRSSSHKSKKEDSKSKTVERIPSPSKTQSKTEGVTSPGPASKSDISKNVETKEAATLSSPSDDHHSTKKSTSSNKQSSSSNHRTRSNSVTAKEITGKDKVSSSKDNSMSKKTQASASGSDDQQSAEAKVGLRSSRSRKPSVETSTKTPDPQETPIKREKVKAVLETPHRSRHSERVCRATEKAIASGLSSKRKVTSVENTVSNTEKPVVSNREELGTSHKRGKRKADLSPSSEKEENTGSKRRTTRSSETPSNDIPPSSTQLRSTRKSKSLKRKGSSSDSPPPKQAHRVETSPKHGVEEEFIAGIPQMCRICGSKNDNLLNVFGPEGQTMKLAEKVHNILPIRMREDEPLPSGVCHSCVVTLIACEKLVEKCSSIDKRLRIHYNCPLEEQSKEKRNRSSETPTTINPTKSEKSSVKISVKSTDSSDSTVVEGSSKPASVTRSSSRVSAKMKLTNNSHKSGDSSQPTDKTVSSQEKNEPSVAKKRSLAPNPEVEDSPPVLEAEPPQSHLPPSNHEPSAQPPVLIPQPGKPLPGLVPIPAEDPSNAMKRFGNTYRARMKQGQWEKIEKGLEAIHGEQSEDDLEESSESKVFDGAKTEAFHIVDLDMNVEEVPPETQEVVSNTPSNVSTDLCVEIPELAEEENTAVPSSPKSVIDSILVDWSGDEDDVGPEQRVNVVAPDKTSNAAGGHKDNVNGKPSVASITPCLFGDDEDGEIPTRSKSKSSPVVVKQESFWPDPEPGMSNTQTTEKHPNDVPWKCFVCGKRGKSVAKFLEHKKLHLNDRKLVSCPKCSESFSNVGLLKSHMKAHHGDDDDDEVVERQSRQTRRKVAPVVQEDDAVVDVDLTPAVDGLYHCSLCQSSFTTIENLCQHKLVHQKTDVAVYKCTVCKRAFFQAKDYEEHMAFHETGTQNQGKFQCAKCDIRVSSQKEFLDHINNAHSTESFLCDMCNKSFDNRSKLRNHRSTAHKSTAYACHLCDKVCQKRITLVEHLRKHTGDNPFACPVCNKRFNRLANYKAHMTIHENARRFECPYCGKRFNRQSIQQRHIKTHTNEQSRKHRCRVCNLSFNVATEMYTHRKLHTREEVERANWEDEKLRMALATFPCKVCQTPFNSVEDVLAHMSSHTDDERDIAVKLKNPRLECDICGKFLNSKRTFNAHRSSHIDGKPFVCKICSKGYSTSTGLNYHMLSHTGERPFPCTFCNKGYKNSTDLKVHMRQHTGEFPYKCNQCNKAFRSASSLQKHGFVHTEERPFQCQYCKMAFKREGTKLNHERIHTNDRRFKCKVCTRTFIQKGACDAHEKLHFRGGTQIFMTLSDSLVDTHTVSTNSGNSSSATTSGTDKHDIFDDFEEEEFEEDDDDEDEYIIYEDDSMEDGDNEEREEEEMTIDDLDQRNDNDPLKGSALDEISFVENTRGSNGVDLPTTSITPIPITLSGDTIPSVGDSSVHITIL